MRARMSWVRLNLPKSISDAPFMTYLHIGEAI
jgi:hypothetical protein